jgi:glucose/arabinose dehydrogenase
VRAECVIGNERLAHEVRALRRNARGRPVGVAVDKRGALLVADDVGNAVWRMAPAGG